MYDGDAHIHVSCQELPQKHSTLPMPQKAKLFLAADPTGEITNTYFLHFLRTRLLQYLLQLQKL